MLELETVFSYV